MHFDTRGAEAEKVVEHRLPPLNRRSADLTLSNAFWLEEEFSVYLPSREILFPLCSCSFSLQMLHVKGVFACVCFLSVSVSKGKRYRLERERSRDVRLEPALSPSHEKKSGQYHTFCFQVGACVGEFCDETKWRYCVGLCVEIRGRYPLNLYPKKFLVWIPG